MQVHIKHIGTAGMLFNPTKLQGIARKIQKLAVRRWGHQPGRNIACCQCHVFHGQARKPVLPLMEGLVLPVVILLFQ